MKKKREQTIPIDEDDATPNIDRNHDETVLFETVIIKNADASTSAP